MTQRRSWLVLRTIVLLGALLPSLLIAATGDSCCQLTMSRLKELDVCALEQLFTNAAPGPIPNGSARGKILRLTCTRLPRIKAGAAGAVWKGKVFEEDGSFTNQWLGFKALDSQAIYGPSWFDDKPCIIMEYPSDTPVFGNVRDEIREVAPGLYVGRFYDRCPKPRLRGYFALEVKQCGCR